MLNERPFRSVLYIPGSNVRALEKARGLPVDAIIFDLEDAVSPDAKVEARQILAGELAAGGYGGRTCLVRVNGLNTDWGADDLAAFDGVAIDGILLPKVNGAADVDRVAVLVPDTPIWAMIETPQGVLNAAEIGAHPQIGGFILGTNDLAKELRCQPGAARGALVTSLQMALLGARASGIVCVDGVYNAFKDTDGLARECEQGRDFGFDGKTLIHPAQVGVANRIFAPAEAEVEMAHRHIAAFADAQAQGKGVAVVDGQIVENLHVETAQAVLAKVAAIAAMEGAEE